MSVLSNTDASPSTGPRTPEGKAISSMNALKHGFSSKNIIIMSGQEDDFRSLESGLTSQVRPEGLLEDSLFHQLLRDAWTLHRVEIRQVEMAASGVDPLFDPNCEKEFDRLERYHSRYQSSFHRSLRQLRNLQTNRVVQNLLPEPLGQGGLPALVKATEIIALAKRTTKQFHSQALNSLITVTQRSRNTPQPISHKDFLKDREIA
ncbi:MAG: hypothetical protein JJE04_12625 [Acidobacteriia bacterium]|nr:hypothetical protein [Terriglobia bacterium]